MIFCSVKFVRTSGIGNKLFIWARCLLFCESHGAMMLPPSWVGIRRGPLLREGSLLGGVALSSIFGKIYLFGNFISPSYTDRAKAIWKKLTLKVTNEIDYSPNAHVELLQFGRLDESFSSLVGKSEFIRKQLIFLTKKKVLNRILHVQVPPVIINVRIGKDFKLATKIEDFQTSGALRTPLFWFAEALNSIRKFSKSEVPALVISDGSDSELAELLRIPGVSRLCSSTAIEDLLVLSKAKVIIGSGGSTFTAWGAFLAQSHVITLRGQNLSWFNLDVATRGHVVVWDFADAENPKISEICESIG